jgi:CheY-like chemotaxis protein
MPASPLAVTLISDLFFTVQVEQALGALGYRIQRIERGTDLEPEPEGALERELPRAYLGEPLAGRGAIFIRRLAEWQPALIIVELSSTAIPWAEWIAAAKSSPATRRIPVLAFGPHTDLALRETALDAGVDAVVAKSRLVTALPELIQQYARVFDYAGLQSDCSGRPSALALKGMALFNARQYFEAHEELELAWKEETGPVRELYRGILQVAVAYLHINRRNFRGALKMFLRLRQWLDPLPDECLGVDVARLRADALAARARLEELGPERMLEFNVEELPRLIFEPPVNGRASETS